MSETGKNTAVKAVKQAAAAAAIALSAILAGCGSAFAGTYKYDGGTLTVKADGTCTDESYGIQTACKWKQSGKGKYTVTESTFLGDVSFTVTEDDGNYTVNMMGMSLPLKKQ